MMEYKTIKTAVGSMTLVASRSKLLIIAWDENLFKSVSDETVLRKNGKNLVLQETEIQLKKYFSGNLKTFRLPIAPRGTSFQKKVWDCLLEIPYGHTLSYSSQAKSIGNPGAVRAVGTANGRNPIAIVIPCHRVISITGQLAGFAGGLDRKKKLLELEGAI